MESGGCLLSQRYRVAAFSCSIRLLPASLKRAGSYSGLSETRLHPAATWGPHPRPKICGALPASIL